MAGMAIVGGRWSDTVLYPLQSVSTCQQIILMKEPPEDPAKGPMGLLHAVRSCLHGKAADGGAFPMGWFKIITRNGRCMNMTQHNCCHS